MNKSIRLFAYDGSTTVCGDLNLYSRDLTTGEAAKQLRTLKRAIAHALESVSYSDFGFDNISIKNIRGQH